MRINHTRTLAILLPALLFTTSALGYAGRHAEQATADGKSQAILDADQALNSCRIYQVTRLPGSGYFASHFLEALATDPSAGPEPRAVWGLTADLSSALPRQQRALYLSKSDNGGKTWTEIARLGPQYFNADIGEGERNGLAVNPGGTSFVITTQRGAFQVFPGSHPDHPRIKKIPGPVVTGPDERVTISKRAGDPVRAGVVQISPDGRRMIVSYGYFDLNPRLYSYHKAPDGSWAEDGPLPHIPTSMDILSMEWGSLRTQHPYLLYIGTGDQAFILNLRTLGWTQIQGVGPDSAIQGISMPRGPHLASCWGVYSPIGPDEVRRALDVQFLLYRAEDEAGPNLRAFDIAVDSRRPTHEVVAGLTGVYVSTDGGWHWRRLNQLPDGEYRTVHFNPDGTIIISGIEGAFVANPFGRACAPQLKTRSQ